MNHYLDIRLRPDPGFAPPQLMSALFAKLHRALTQLGSDNIGVSFPEAGSSIPTLGKMLRLHGASQTLQNLMARDWLLSMRDHTECDALTAIPNGVAHRRVIRVQAKSNPDRLRRRLMRRHKISEGEAKRRIPDTAIETLKLPFVQISSGSTRQKFRLFIQHGELKYEAHPGTFNAYGLSDFATIPWF